MVLAAVTNSSIEGDSRALPIVVNGASQVTVDDFDAGGGAGRCASSHLCVKISFGCIRFSGTVCSIFRKRSKRSAPSGYFLNAERSEDIMRHNTRQILREHAARTKISLLNIKRTRRKNDSLSMHSL